MKIYNYNPDTMILTSIGDADESPCEPGVYLIPAAATTITPPEFDSATQVCCFVNDCWQIIELTKPLPEPGLTDKEKIAKRLLEISGRFAQIDVEYGPRYIRDFALANPTGINETAINKLKVAEIEAAALRIEQNNLL